MEIGSFQDGNPMEICCKLMVSMFFPHVFPEGKLPFFALPLVRIYTLLRQTNVRKNKRPMGHIAHMRKQFKSIET